MTNLSTYNSKCYIMYMNEWIFEEITQFSFYIFRFFFSGQFVFQSERSWPKSRNRLWQACIHSTDKTWYQCKQYRSSGWISGSLWRPCIHSTDKTRYHCKQYRSSGWISGSLWMKFPVCGPQKMFVFTIWRPTLIFGPDPKIFYGTFHRNFFKYPIFAF